MSGHSELATNDKLTELINNDISNHVRMPWGSHGRKGFTIDGRRCQYSGNIISKILEIKINHYI